MSPYGISEVARRSGFAPSTLRYYESVGLLPEPQRSPAGYRVYDDGAVDRLAFIARAKRLGLRLDDIAELVDLWADGSCSTVQERLRDLLDDKLGSVRASSIELHAFASQLETLRRGLDDAAPTERCAPGCGCDAELADPVVSPVVCTLPAGDAPERVRDWAAVLARVDRRDPIERGLRLRLPADPPLLADVADLAVREAACCAFFTFTMRVGGEGMWLDVTAPADGQPVLEALFGDGGHSASGS